MQGTQVQSLVQEDSTYRGALEHVLHNKTSHHSEKPVLHKGEQPPLSATKESLWAATKTQHSQQFKN